MLIQDGAKLLLDYSEQFSRTSHITLKSTNNTSSTITFGHLRSTDLKETLSRITINGNGIIDFGIEDNHGIHKFILDDLEIIDGSHLTIQNWQSRRDFLLVRKDSVHLYDSLNKISFAGGIDQVELVDYDADYYSISNTPEPAAYGAGVMAIGLVAFAWKRKQSARTILS